MNQKITDIHAFTSGLPSRLVCWLAPLVAALLLAAFSLYIEAGKLAFGVPFESLYSFQLTIYSDLLLLAATVVYVAHWRFTGKAVGRWATTLASTGTAGVMAGVLTRWFEMPRVWEEGHVPLSDLYEVTGLFTAATMVIYLAMESFYRNRSAGAFVMPIVSVAVAFDIWLMANGQASPNHLPTALDGVWLDAHVLANVVGYGAFSVAAGMGGLYLIRYLADARIKVEEYSTNIRMSPRLDLLEDLMVKTIIVGFCVFTLATLLGSVWAHQVWGSYWSWEPKQTWALVVWLTYALFFYFRYARGWLGVRTAWWVIAGFCMTLFSFIGVNFLFTGLHAFGKLH